MKHRKVKKKRSRLVRKMDRLRDAIHAIHGSRRHRQAIVRKAMREVDEAQKDYKRAT